MNKSYKTDSFEFRINDISFNELINLYNRVNFLYPEKKRDISVFLPLIEQNWKKGIEGKKTVTMGSFQPTFKHPKNGNNFIMEINK